MRILGLRIPAVHSADETLVGSVRSFGMADISSLVSEGYDIGATSSAIPILEDPTMNGVSW